MGIGDGVVSFVTASSPFFCMETFRYLLICSQVSHIVDFNPVLSAIFL